MTAYQKTLREFLEHNVVFGNTREKSLEILQRFSSNPGSYVICDTETTGLEPWSGVTSYCASEYREAWNALATKRVSKNFTTEQKIRELQALQKKAVRLRIGADIFAVQLGFYCPKENKLYCTFTYIEDIESMTHVKRVLNSRVRKVFHNAKFDLHMLNKAGIKWQEEIYDTIVASRLTCDFLYNHSLDNLGNYFSGVPEKDSNSETWKKDFDKWWRKASSASTRLGNPTKKKGNKFDYLNYSFAPDNVIRPYGLLDIWYTWLVYTLTEDQVRELYWPLFQMEMAIIFIAMNIERRGVKINRNTLKTACRELAARTKQLREEIATEATEYGVKDFNPNSHKQLVSLLLKSGVPENELLLHHKVSASAEILEAVVRRHKLPWVTKLLTLRTCEKLYSTYFLSFYKRTKDSYPVIHCNLRTNDTVTSRMACSDPNLQNIPKPLENSGNHVPDVRSVFIPRPGNVLLFFDYSQIEMRVFALYCQERSMLKAFKQRRDLHAETAQLMFGTVNEKTRYQAKTINFGIIYGMGIRTLSNKLGVSFEEARTLREQYSEKFSMIDCMVRRAKQQLYRQNYAEDIFGRRYHLDYSEHYKIVNRLVQGTSASILKTAILQVCRMYPNIALWPPVHDETIIEVPIETLWNTPIVRLITLAMTEIEAVKQYGLINLAVDCEYSYRSWGTKESYTAKENENAVSEEFRKIRNHIVIPSQTEEPVDWFIQ